MYLRLHLTKSHEDLPHRELKVIPDTCASHWFYAEESKSEAFQLSGNQAIFNRRDAQHGSANRCPYSH